jgi:predicted MPP superfamily phosphohydrolase
MIARAPYLFLLLIIIPDLYFDLHYWRHKYSAGQRFCRWLPTIGLVAYTIYLMYEKNFIPDNPTIIYIYLFLLGLIAIPKVVYMLFSLVGLSFSHLFHRKKSAHPHKNYGNLIGLVCVPILWFILIYGSFVGFSELEINRHTYTSPDIPKAFNGYRIVQFSDAHVGSYTDSRKEILQRAVDSINALRPDLIVFTGDLQNVKPEELYSQMDILSRLKAKDGVYSVLGNHDYAKYVDCSEAEKAANCRETVSLEKQLGWTLLQNEHRYIERGKSRIVIAGMENDGDGKNFPQKGNISKTLKGVDNDDFILMLEHDPSSWRRKIIPDGRAQLTLSGHTHKMQFALFGWSPMSLLGREFNDWYTEGSQSLFVTAGLGGLIPFRFGATGEIVVLTLRKG